MRDFELTAFKHDDLETAADMFRGDYIARHREWVKQENVKVGDVFMVMFRPDNDLLREEWIELSENDGDPWVDAFMGTGVQMVVADPSSHFGVACVTPDDAEKLGRPHFYPYFALVRINEQDWDDDIVELREYLMGENNA